jgi:hypothetical protein
MFTLANTIRYNFNQMIRKLVVIAGVLACAFSVRAQESINLVVFSEDGDAFYAYVNGTKQNDKPETNVKVVGVSPNVSLRIEFENKALPNLKQNMALDPGFEHTAMIRRDMKQQVKLRYFGKKELGSESAGTAAVQYHSTETPASSSSDGVTHITTETSTSTHTGSQDAAMNMNGGGVSISMNVTGMDQQGAQVRSTTSSTVTTTTRTTGSGVQQAAISDTKATSAAASAGTGCSAAMNQQNFSKMKSSIESKPFSDTKMSTAKVATKNACLSADQITELCKLFSMDDDKLTYAKYAWDSCVDKGNYYRVSEAFSFSGTTEELNKFLEQK